MESHWTRSFERPHAEGHRWWAAGRREREGRYKGRWDVGGTQRGKGFRGEEVVFGSNGRTRSVVTRCAFIRASASGAVRAWESSFTRSLARPACCSTLEHYLLLLTLCVVHARRPLQPMIAADDVVVGCCRCVVGGGAVPPFCTLPPFGSSHRQLSAAATAASPPSPPLLPPPEIPFGSRSFARRTRGQAGAGGETTTSTASTTPSDARPSDHRRSRRAGTFSRPPRQPHIRHPHTELTFSLRGTTFRLRRSNLALVITATRCY